MKKITRRDIIESHLMSENYFPEAEEGYKCPNYYIGGIAIRKEKIDSGHREKWFLFDKEVLEKFKIALKDCEFDMECEKKDVYEEKWALQNIIEGIEKLDIYLITKKAMRRAFKYYREYFPGITHKIAIGMVMDITAPGAIGFLNHLIKKVEKELE
jgi:hypothetical protein